MSKQKVSSTFTPRPPIVTVMGHVDHGKTTLLDTIRKTNLAAKEYGNITQHIGAYQINIDPKTLPHRQAGKNQEARKITFIDTPGHEAFAKMRARGAQVADIAVLIVAADDGIKPQTLESIQHIKSAAIPYIIAINKIDLPNVNIDKIKKQLVKVGCSLEEYGGETPVVSLSAKTGQGIDKLLDTILLLTEIYQVKQDPSGEVEAVVIESTISKSRGPVATIILRNSTLDVGSEIVCDNQSFRIRALFDYKGNSINTLTAGEPAEVLGWKDLPKVGSKVFIRKKGGLTQFNEKAVKVSTKPVTLASPANIQIEKEKINLIVKGDTAGTLEAIISGLKENVEVIFKGVGSITESDVLLAKTTHAIIVGFHQKISENVVKLAQTEKVIIKTYNVIYELFKEIGEVIEAIKHGDLVSQLGEAKIVALFTIKDYVVAGIKVISGRIARGDQIKVMRGEELLGRARIKSLRQRKEDITRVEQGAEAGVVLSQKLDFLTGDSIIAIA